MIVAIAGASGVVGSALLKECIACKEVSEIYIVARSKVNIISPQVKFIYSNFEKFEDFPKKIDIAFSALGTTIKKAGSKEQFYKVDVLYQEAFAKQCKASSADVFALVSSAGANSESILNYPRCKGIVERKIADLSFTHYKIYRPSLLIAPRKEKRFAEDVAKFIYTIFEKSSFHRKIGTKVDTLASFMLQTCLSEQHAAVQIYEPAAIDSNKLQIKHKS